MFPFSARKVRIKFSTVTASETGLVRSENEDHVFRNVPAAVFGVADGMGGAAEGARASAMVAEALAAANLAAVGPDLTSTIDVITTAVTHAHVDIATYARDRGFDMMGSTVALLAFDRQNTSRAAIGYVGDSRVYRVRHGFAEPLTTDHTVGTQMAQFAGKNAPDFKDRANPLAHILTRAIGVPSNTFKIDWHTVNVSHGDRFVLCTDGVHDVVSDARLAVCVSGGSLASAKKRLTDTILSAGAPDNFSFVIVEVSMCS